MNVNLGFAKGETMNAEINYEKLLYFLKMTISIQLTKQLFILMTILKKYSIILDASDNMKNHIGQDIAIF